MREYPPTKLSKLQAAMAAEDWPRALSIAAKFHDLGTADQEEAITRGHGAVQNPRFYRQIGCSPAALIDAGRAALIERYGGAGRCVN